MAILSEGMDHKAALSHGANLVCIAAKLEPLVAELAKAVCALPDGDPAADAPLSIDAAFATPIERCYARTSLATLSAVGD